MSWAYAMTTFNSPSIRTMDWLNRTTVRLTTSTLEDTYANSTKQQLKQMKIKGRDKVMRID